jgi:hypothetical protein
MGESFEFPLVESVYSHKLILPVLLTPTK